MIELVLFRAGRALVVTLSALTLAHLLELSHRLAYDERLWAQLTGPDALYRYFGMVGGPLEVVLPANVGIGGWRSSGIPVDWERWRIHWETGHAVSFALLLLGFGALVLAVLSEPHPRQHGRPLPADPVPGVPG